jgi:hypothetical protein
VIPRKPILSRQMYDKVLEALADTEGKDAAACFMAAHYERADPIPVDNSWTNLDKPGPDSK